VGEFMMEEKSELFTMYLLCPRCRAREMAMYKTNAVLAITAFGVKQMFDTH
jgi:hypothetical protein